MQLAAFWDRVPNNAHFSALPRGSPEYFAEVRAKRYSKKWLVDFAKFEQWKGARVLDLGCGIGSDAVMFAKAGAEVTAVDFSWVSLALAQRHAEVENVEVRFVHADIEKVTFGPYDLVWAWQVLHHLRQPAQVLDRVWDGGVRQLRACVHNRDSHRQWSGQWQPKYPVQHRWTWQEARELFGHPRKSVRVKTCYFGEHPGMARFLPAQFGWYHLVEATQ